MSNSMCHAKLYPPTFNIFNWSHTREAIEILKSFDLPFHRLFDLLGHSIYITISASFYFHISIRKSVVISIYFKNQVRKYSVDYKQSFKLCLHFGIFIWFNMLNYSCIWLQFTSQSLCEQNWGSTHVQCVTHRSKVITILTHRLKVIKRPAFFCICYILRQT